MKTGKELHEHSLAFAYDRYPWRVTVASESYKAGYRAAARDAEKFNAAEQFAKAKTIIKALLNIFVYDLTEDELNPVEVDVRTAAEEFLKEEC